MALGRNQNAETFANLGRTFETPLPEADTLDELLDKIMSRIAPYSKSIREEGFYLEKPWLEVNDSDDFFETVLHFYNEGGEYLKSVDGEVDAGSWRLMESSGKFLLEMDGTATLYDPAFLNENFFILRRHGNPRITGSRKYFMMVLEKRGRNLEWRDSVEFLFNNYRSGSTSLLVTIAISVIVVLIILLLS